MLVILKTGINSTGQGWCSVKNTLLYYAKSLQSCLTPCDPMDCRSVGSSVRGILQAKIPEWIAISSSRGSSGPRDRNHVSCIPCIAGGFCTIEPLGNALKTSSDQIRSDQSRPTLCDPMNRSTPGIPVHHQLPEFTQTHAIESVMPSSHLILCCPFSSCPQSLPASESFPMSQLFA